MTALNVLLGFAAGVIGMLGVVGLARGDESTGMMALGFLGTGVGLLVVALLVPIT